MPRLFLVSDKESPQDSPEPTVETPSALWRLGSMLETAAQSVVGPAPAVDAAADELDPDTNNEDRDPAYESASSGDGTVTASPTSEEETDEMRRAVAPNPTESNEVVSSDAVAGDLPDGAIRAAAGVRIGRTGDRSDAVASFRSAVGQAEEEAETQLLAFVECVRKEA